MLKKYSLLALQTAINQGIRLDEHVSRKLEPLMGKWLEIIIEPLMVNFFMGFEHDGIILQDSCPSPANTIIHSSPLGLIRLSLLPASQARSLFNDKIRMQGDVEFGQEVKQLFDNLDIDWEGHLAQFTGDIVAHQVGSFWRQSRAAGEKLFHSLHRNVEEYVKEELRVSPTKEELDDFFDDVDNLSMELERLEARLTYWVAKNEIN